MAEWVTVDRSSGERATSRWFPPLGNASGLFPGSGVSGSGSGSGLRHLAVLSGHSAPCHACQVLLLGWRRVGFCSSCNGGGPVPSLVFSQAIPNSVSVTLVIPLTAREREIPFVGSRRETDSRGEAGKSIATSASSGNQSITSLGSFGNIG